MDALLWVQPCAGCHEAVNIKEIHAAAYDAAKETVWHSG